MNKKVAISIFVLIAGLMLSVNLLIAQGNLPTIKATAIMVDIKDGGKLNKSAWRISPELKPDRYITSNKNTTVTFYTDIDSISYTVLPNKPFQFIILLNGKDTALTEIFYVPPYRETLQKAAKYDNYQNRVIPKFTYQSASDPNLKSLRKHFNLDSIAGKGTELTQVVNLMQWLHNLVPHDGTHGNPPIMNAQSMIEVCKKDKRGLNCRGLAITLNECFLSMGFNSRYVTCLPKDSLKIDTDCHVINTVYLKSLGKWIWIDPTFNAYIMDEKSQPLSIEEVRQRIIDDHPLVINPEANWNNKNPVVKEQYLLNYMAKNLYMLECLVASEFNAETSEKRDAPLKPKVVEYVRLLPLDYYEQIPDKKGNVYRTNNSNLFWEKQ